MTQQKKVNEDPAKKKGIVRAKRIMKLLHQLYNSGLGQLWGKGCLLGGGGQGAACRCRLQGRGFWVTAIYVWSKKIIEKTAITVPRFLPIWKRVNRPCYFAANRHCQCWHGRRNCLPCYCPGGSLRKAASPAADPDVGSHNYCRATGMGNTTPWCFVNGVAGSWAQGGPCPRKEAKGQLLGPTAPTSCPSNQEEAFSPLITKEYST